MLPPISDPQTWQAAEQLMQPALIRLLDNLRKALETADWTSSYETIKTWPQGVTEAEKTQWEGLVSQLRGATPEEVDQLEAAIALLPQPQYTYWLRLVRGEEQRSFDLWQLCYQICFRDYPVVSGMRGEEAIEPGITLPNPLRIDQKLFDEEGDVDWEALEEKTKAVVEQLVEQLAEQ